MVLLGRVCVWAIGKPFLLSNFLCQTAIFSLKPRRVNDEDAGSRMGDEDVQL